MRWILAAILLMVPQQVRIPGPGGSSQNVSVPTVIEYLCSNNLGMGGCQADGSTSATITLGSTTVLNDCLVVFTAGSPTGTNYGTVIDSSSTSYTQDPVLRKTGIGAHIATTSWSKCGLPAGITSVTWTYGSGDSASGSHMIVVHLKNVSAYSTSANFPASASNTPYTSASITPTAGHAMWIGTVVQTAFGTSTTISATSPWTLRIVTGAQPVVNSIALFDQIITSTSGSYSGQGTGTTASAMYFPGIVAYTQ